MLVALHSRLAIRGVYQAFSSTPSGVERASQAEYAGSIPSMGFEGCAVVHATEFNKASSHPPVTAPSPAATNSMNVCSPLPAFVVSTSG
jgi:hypothetical protein